MPFTSGKQEGNQSKQVGKVETQSHSKSHPHTKEEGTQNPELQPEKRRVHTPTFHMGTRETASIASASKTNRAGLWQTEAQLFKVPTGRLAGPPPTPRQGPAQKQPFENHQKKTHLIILKHWS